MISRASAGSPFATSFNWWMAEQPNPSRAGFKPGFSTRIHPFPGRIA
jgi:hypothetical protein